METFTNKQNDDEGKTGMNITHDNENENTRDIMNEERQKKILEAIDRAKERFSKSTFPDIEAWIKRSPASSRLPRLPDKKELHKVYKGKYLDYTISIYATEATHHPTTDYYAYLKHISGRRNRLTKTTDSFTSKEEAYCAAILWLTQFHGYDVPSVSDIINVPQENK